MASDSRWSFGRDLSLVLSAIVFWAASAAAEVSRVAGTMEGTVSDSSSGAMPGVKVSIRNTLTSQLRTVTTDEQGVFRAEQLAVGSYEVRVEHPGFAAYRQTGVLLTLGQTLHLNIGLPPASGTATITVKAEPSAIDTSQTSVVSSVDQERIEELPVRTRDYLDFVLLAPGVSKKGNRGLGLYLETGKAIRRLSVSVAPEPIAKHH
jgi:hypothetical protein